MKETVPVAQATSDETVLPERVQEALGQLVGAAKEGLLALSVGVGLGVLSEMLEEEVDDVVGPKGKWNPDRAAVRHGHDSGEVTLGGRRVEVRRPRVRTADGEAEVPLRTYEHFADRDPLARVVLERMLAGVSTRRYRRTQEPVGEEVEAVARSTSKSAVSRTFVERTRQALGELMSRQLADLRLAVMMIDGIELKERMMIVALGITTEGVKIPLGLWEGSTENATVATALLSDLVERGLDPEQGMLFVIDGSKALRKAVRTVFGEVPVQRCVRHKERNVIRHLAERDRPPILARMRLAWAETDYDRALEQLKRLATELEHTHPGAAGSLRGDGRDPDRDPAQDQGQAQAHAREHEPVRVDARLRPHHPAQRQALVLGRDGTAMDRRRNARSREAVPQGDRLHPAPAARDRDRAATPPSTAHPRHPTGGHHRSNYVTITPGPPSPKFHTGGGNLHEHSRSASNRWSCAAKRRRSLCGSAEPTIAAGWLAAVAGERPVEGELRGVSDVARDRFDRVV